jgi:hypothetical protein
MSKIQNLVKGWGYEPNTFRVWTRFVGSGYDGKFFEVSKCHEAYEFAVYSTARGW